MIKVLTHFLLHTQLLQLYCYKCASLCMCVRALTLMLYFIYYNIVVRLVFYDRYLSVEIGNRSLTSCWRARRAWRTRGAAGRSARARARRRPARGGGAAWARPAGPTARRCAGSARSPTPPRGTLEYCTHAHNYTNQFSFKIYFDLSE